MANDKDFVAHGSDGHAALLNLKKATKDDNYAVDGWTFADVTLVDPRGTAREDYILARLKQTVTELKTAPVVPPDAAQAWQPKYT